MYGCKSSPMQECHAFEADCVNDLVEPWGLVRTTLKDWPPSQYDYSYAEDAGMLGKPPLKLS